MLHYQEFTPALHLQPYIRKYWVLDNLSSSLATDVKYALPNTCFTLAIVVGKGALINYFGKGASVKISEGIYIVGQVTTSTGISILPHTKAVMVQLNAWAASFITGCSFHELTNQITIVSDVNKSLCRLLAGINIIDNHQLSRVFEKILTPVFFPLSGSTVINNCIAYLCQNIGSEKFTITSLAEKAGYSVRGLEKQFKQHVGLSPKQFYTILKVRSTVDDLASPDMDVTLTTLAYRYGYTDQAHFIKAFKAVMNITPGKFDQQQYLIPLIR